jgi:signal transduction histidine kinase
MARSFSHLGAIDEDRFAFLRVLATTLGARWLVARVADSWVEWGPGGVRVGSDATAAPRRLDFGVIEALPTGRLVRLAGPALSRRPRWCDGVTREVLVHVAANRRPPRPLLVFGLVRPLAVDPEELDAAMQAWFALEEARQRVRTRLETERLADLGRRAGALLHDLRHELTIATLEVDRLGEGDEAADEPAADSGWSALRRSLARARDMGEDGLAAATPPARTRCAITELLREEAGNAARVAGRGAAVHIEVVGEVHWEHPVDAGSLARLVRNLLLNAIEASPEGDTVMVKAASDPDGSLTISILDRGRGMSALDGEAWSRFGRGRGAGWGIGTASVDACARRLGASTRCESTLGAGTTIEIRIPRDPADRLPSTR